MKEAAGEANLTVVAIILIAVVVAVATPLIRSLMKTTARRSCCNDSGAIWKNGHCYASESDSALAQDDAYTECLKANKDNDNLLTD